MTGSVEQRASRDLVEEMHATMARKELLSQALTHGSWSHATAGTENYERLEFLGDSVLGLVVVDALYRRFPDEAEGNLSRAKASLVSAPELARVARRFGVDEHIRLSGSPAGLSRRGRDSILADVFEALIGAMYLDRGFDATREWLMELFDDAFEGLDPSAKFADYKSELQERTQGLLQERPRYVVAQKSGPSHKPIFEARAVLLTLELGVGEGPSKKIAEQNAASIALGRIDDGKISLQDLLEP